jgi:hypothetical protein
MYPPVNDIFGSSLAQVGRYYIPPFYDFVQIRHREVAGGRSMRFRFTVCAGTATTLLHEAGVPSIVAQALIGHDSEEVHSDYITVGREALRNATHKFSAL